MKMYDIASRMAGYLACQVDLEQSRVDEVRYGLEVILGQIIKWVMLLASAAFLGVLPGALAAMLSMSVYRMVSGGAHCEDYWRCLAFGMITYLGAGEMGVYMAPYLSYKALVVLVAASFLLMAALTFIWAPGEVVHRRITTQERPLFKLLSMVCLVVWAVITVFFIAPSSIPVALSGLLAMLVQSFSFIPWGFRAIDSFDIALSNIIGERRCAQNAQEV